MTLDMKFWSSKACWKISLRTLTLLQPGHQLASDAVRVEIAWTVPKRHVDVVSNFLDSDPVAQFVLFLGHFWGLCSWRVTLTSRHPPVRMLLLLLKCKCHKTPGLAHCFFVVGFLKHSKGLIQRFPEFNTTFDVHSPLKSQVRGEIANAHIPVVTKMHVIRVLMLLKRCELGKYTHKSFCLRLLHAHYWTALGKFAIETLSLSLSLRTFWLPLSGRLCPSFFHQTRA